MSRRTTKQIQANIVNPNQTAPGQGLRCWSFRVHLSSALVFSQTKLFKVQDNYAKVHDPTPLVLNASPDVTTPLPDRQSLWLDLIKPASIAQLVECPLRGTGGHGFDPGPRHTKVVKNGTSCSSLGTQTYGVELGLVDPVSG